jgi:multidrug efflux pump
MVVRAQAMAKVAMADPDTRAVYYWIGANPTVNTGRLWIDLKPFNERKATATEIINRLRRASLVVPGVALFGQARQDVQIGAKVSKTQFQYTLQDPDIGELFKWAPVVLDRLSKLPELQDVTGDLQATAPRMMLKIDRNAIGRFGITPQAIDDTLYDSFGQRQVATVFGQIDQHRVILEVTPSYQQDASSLQKLYVRSSLSGRVGIAAHHQPPGSVSLGDAVLQSRPWPFAWRRTHRNREHGKVLRQAGDALGAVPGLRQGIPDLACDTALPHRGGDHHGLHRARHAL